MYKRNFMFLLLIMISLSFTSCGNIFDWFYPDEVTDSTDIEGLMASADAALQSGDFYTAWKTYKTVIDADTVNSRARWGYAQAYVLDQGVTLLVVASKFVAGEDPATVISPAATTLTNIMGQVAWALRPIARGQCDGVISASDFEINLNLMLAYMIQGFLRNGDKPNTDGSYFSTGDLFLLQGGEFSYNTSVVDIGTYQSTIETSIAEISTALSSWPFTVQRSTVSNLLVAAHNITEDLVFVYQIMITSFNDFNEAMYALNNGVAGLGSGQVMQDIQTEINDRYNEASGYLSGSYADTTNLNRDHMRVVGTNMYGFSFTPNWFSSFSKSSWTNIHLSTPYNTTYALNKTNLFYRFDISSGDFGTNHLNYLIDVQSVISNILSDIENSNLLGNLGL
ncbi:MAG: hypothetical protein JW827_08685 [Spirochaetes bacterium]|nr:hypothetical protein [Spirochaetota bacterium]